MSSDREQDLGAGDPRGIAAAHPEPTRVSPDEPSDAELWQAAQSDGDGGASLARLYDRHAGLVFGIALRILASRQDAEDLVQDIFITLCDKGSFDPSRGSLGAYLSVLTRSRAIDRLRRGARQRKLGDDFLAAEPPEPDRNTPFARTSSMETSVKVSEALKALPARQRQALELAYYGGLTQTEIAAEMEAPLGTVKSTVRAGLHNLRSALGSLVE